MSLKQNTDDRRWTDDAESQAEVFGHVRQAHQMETTEDYAELIDDLIQTHGEARLVDLAERMGVSQPTASKTIHRLQRDGYVTSEPYRSIFLTDKGKALAETARARHNLVYEFLLSIGVSEEVAQRDSEGVEHHVSQETLDAFQRIIDTQAKR